MSAKYARISTKEWTLESLISSSGNFHAVDRVPANSRELSHFIKDHEAKGLPLAIEGFHRQEGWPAEMFTIEGFQRNSESSDIGVRNVHSWTDNVMNLTDFVLQSRRIGPLAEEGETERLYGKDAECPHAWDKWLQESNVLPSIVLSHGKEDEFRFRPASCRIETLMCYLGVGDTYTPCHKDLCASSGQNLMCYTENNGSSFWFMTESSNAPKASAYFHKLGQELDHENHVITLEQLRRAPFNIYILEQRLGDLVLVPPRSCHQVVNYGGITIKTSWSRMTLKGLSTAYHHELPIYRRVGRPETYRIKSTIHYALTSRMQELDIQLSFQFPGSSSGPSISQQLDSAHSQMSGIADSRLDDLAKEVVELLRLYDLILVEEKPAGDLKTMCQVLETSFNDDIRIVCDFCDCDIFHSFFECSQCTGGSSSSCIVCPACYSEGRSCRCQAMQPMQCRGFQTLIDSRMAAVDVLRRYSEETGSNDIQLNNQPDENAPRLFQAACLLLQGRKDNKLQKATRVCGRTSGQYPTHEVPSSWGLNCTPCHRSMCFEHLLIHYKMHSAVAIPLFNIDGTRMAYHMKHKLSRTRYGEQLPDLEKSQREGSPADGVVLLAFITSQYVHIVASNPKSLRPGWYDAVPEERDSKRLEDTPNTQSKPTTIIIPPRMATPSRVYVDVPRAPYPIVRKVSEPATKSPEVVHLSSSSEPLPSATGRPKVPLPSRLKIHLPSRLGRQKSEPSTMSKGSEVLASTQPTSSTPLPVATSKKISRPSPQRPKRVQCESLSPQSYLESLEAKKALLGSMHFKRRRCLVPNDNSSSMTHHVFEGRSLDSGSRSFSSPRQDGFSHHPPAQFVPPQEDLAHSALQLSELMNAIGAARPGPEELNPKLPHVPILSLQTSQGTNDPFFLRTDSH